MSGEPSPKHLFDRKLKKTKQLNLKNKLSKQEQRQNHGNGERFDVCQMSGGVGKGEEARGLRSTNR